MTKTKQQNIKLAIVSISCLCLLLCATILFSGCTNTATTIGNLNFAILTTYEGGHTGAEQGFAMVRITNNGTTDATVDTTDFTLKDSANAAVTGLVFEVYTTTGYTTETSFTVADGEYVDISIHYTFTTVTGQYTLAYDGTTILTIMR